MIPEYLFNHLWQSTLFAVAAGLLTLSFNKNRAAVRYNLWLAASLKFLIPFALLVSAGSQVSTIAPSPIFLQTPLTSAVEEFSQPYSMVASQAIQTSVQLPQILFGIWLIGFLLFAAMWLRQWLKLSATLRQARPINLEKLQIRVVSTTARLEPGVFGIFKPTLILPEGITSHLTSTQLQAVIAHELSHIRRHDNLTAGLHMLVEAIFWFHPLVWWIEKRLVEERERACDEEVLRSAAEPQVYAEGIINVCKFYLESPMVCAAGVTGSDLKKRIEQIMSFHGVHQLSFAKKILLAAAALVVVASPVLVGTIYAQQAAQKPLVFAVATIKQASPDAKGTRIGPGPGGGLLVQNFDLKGLIAFAYDIRDFQISGGPGSLMNVKYDIQAKPDESGENTDPAKLTIQERGAFIGQNRQRLKALLADRFQLEVHTEVSELPIYALVQAKSGTKLVESKYTDDSKDSMRTNLGSVEAVLVTMDMLAGALSRITGRPVVNRTRLNKRYDFKMEWTPDPGTAPPGEIAAVNGEGPSLFTAIQEQLGLKLDSTKGPVEVVVIDHVEKPSAN